MTPCLFSVSYAGLWGQAALRVPDFITRTGRLGYRSVMLMAKRPHLSPLDASPAFLKSLKGSLKDAGVSCEVLAGYTNLAPGKAAPAPARTP